MASENTVRIETTLDASKAIKSIDNLKRELATAAKEAERLTTIKANINVNEARSQIKALTKASDEAFESAWKMRKLMEQRAGSLPLKAEYEELLKKIQDASEEYRKLNYELHKAESPKANTDIKVLEEMRAKCDEARKSLEELDKEREKYNSGQLSKTVSADDDEVYQKYKKQHDEYYNKFQTTNDQINEFQNQIDTYHEADSALKVLKSTVASLKAEYADNAEHQKHMAKVAKSVFGTIEKAAKKAVDGVKTLASHTASAAKSIGGVAFSGIKNLTGLGKESKSSGNMVEAFGKKIWGLAKRVFIFSVITKALRSVRSAFGEGISYYLGWDKTLNSQVQALKNSVMELKANFGAAFSPIIEKVVPILQTVVGWLNTATNAMGAFIAAITGKSTYKSVVAGTAQAGQAAANNVADTTKEVKKLKQELADYDELKVISQDDDSSSGSGSGGSGGSGSGGGTGLQFQDVAIGSEIADFVNKLKEAWEKADFTEIGGIIGQKLKNALDSIPWPEIKATAAKVGKSLATLINGFVETEGLGESIGKTLGESINTGLYFLEAYLENLHFDSIGKFVADAINSMLDTIEWDKAYNAAKRWGEGVAQFLNEVANPETLGKIGDAFGKFINTLVYQVQSFVHELEWGAIGMSLGTAVQSAIDSIDWLAIADTFETGVLGLIDLAQNFIQEVDWFDLGEKLKEAITSIHWTEIADQFFELLGNALGGLAAFLGGLLKDAFNSIGDYFDKEIEDAGGNIVLGIFNGIIDALVNIGTWIKEHIFDPIIKGFKDVFGIHSPSKEMEPMGKSIIEGVIEGIKSIPGKILEAIQWLWDKITGDWAETAKDLVLNIVAKGQEILEHVVDVWNSITTYVKELWTKAKETGKAVLEKVADIWDGIVEGTKNLITKAKEKAGFLISTIKDAWTTGWNATKELWTKAQEKAGAFISTIKDAWSKGWETTKLLLSKAQEKAGAFISTIKDAWTKGWTTTKQLFTKAKEKTGHLISTIKDAWTKGWETTKDLVVNAVAKFFGWLKKFFPDGKDIPEEQKVKVTAVLESAFKSLQDWFESWFGGNTVNANVDLEEYDEKNGKSFTTPDWSASGEAPEWLKTKTITVTAHAEWEDETTQKLEKMLDDKGGVTATVTKTKDKTNGSATVDKGTVNVTNTDFGNLSDKKRKFERGTVGVNGSDFSTLSDSNRKFNKGTVGVNSTDFSKLSSDERKFGKGTVGVNSTDFSKLSSDDRKFGKGTVGVDSTDFSTLSNNDRKFGKGTVGVNGSDFSTLSNNDRKFGKGTVGVNGSDFSTLSNSDRKFGKGTVGVSGSDFSGLSTDKRKFDKGTVLVTDATDKIAATKKTIGNMVAEFWSNTGSKGWHYTWSTIGGMIAGFASHTGSRNWHYTWDYIWDMIAGFETHTGSKHMVNGWDIIWNMVAGFTSYVVSSGAGKDTIKRSKGGIFTGSSWQDLPQYARGGSPTHGTVFAAGENGAEVVGTINGRTEVLNKSQIAMAIYDAVKAAMSGFGSDIVKQIAYDTGVVTHYIDVLPERMSNYIPDTNQIQQMNRAYSVNNTIDYNKLAQAMQQQGMGNNNYTFTAQLDGREIFRETVNQNDMYKMQTGHSALA